MTLRRRAPLWFHAAIVALCAAACHWLAPRHLEAPPVSLAFFGWLIAVGEIIWNALQGIGQATLVALEWTVNALWLVAKELRNGLSAFGGDLLKGFRAAWGFVRTLYDDVLKPAWLKFWKLVDAVKQTLEDVFGPVLKFLTYLRCELLQFYVKWVRPILDTIGATQQILRVLEALHIAWAKKLDAELSRIAEAIDRPFRFALEKINEVINLVNRIVTLDGALQRLMFIKTIERDANFIVRLWWNAQIEKDAKPAPGLRGAEKLASASPQQLAADLRAFYDTRGGAYADQIVELAALWEQAAGVAAVNAG